MKRVHLFRAVLLEVVSPAVGIGASGYLLATGTGKAFELPLIVCLIFGGSFARKELSLLGAAISKVGEALTKIGSGDSEE